MLRLIYRSYGGENLKDRPAFYDKRVALLSFLRAAEAAGLSAITFMNDGPIPDDRLELMQAATTEADIVSLPGLGMRGSYVAGLKLPLQRNWADSDIVWFSEDDYLYHHDAFIALSAATRELDAEYFALYGSTPDRPVYPRDEFEASIPRGWRKLPARDVDGHRWVNIISTASTFGVRVGALREDLSIFRQCMLPYRNMYLDHETCLLYQGFQPYRWSEPWLDVVQGRGGRMRAAVLLPFKLALNARSYRSASRRRLLMGVDPNLAVHAEPRYLSPGMDWTAVARETLEWARVRQLSSAAEPRARSVTQEVQPPVETS